MFRIENSCSGSIGEVNHLLLTRNVAVVDEEFWQVEHCLVGLPGAEPKNLREITLVRYNSDSRSLRSFQTFGAAYRVPKKNGADSFHSGYVGGGADPQLHYLLVRF